MVSTSMAALVRPDLRLDGGAAAEEGMSSASLARFRPPGVARPRLAADMLGRSGELVGVSGVPQYDVLAVITSLSDFDIPVQ